MSRRDRLSDEAITAFTAEHAGWTAEGGALVKTFAFDDYAAGIAFVVRLGFAAEAQDHHPDLYVGWRKVRVLWTTHDRGGITGLDAEMAAFSDQIHKA
jgi:4a-hydroxytetrahydrobiopterin dehydratase